MTETEMEIPVYGFMRMTRVEIARLKEELTADYKRKLEALELVEQMFDQQLKSQPPTRSRNKVQADQSPSLPPRSREPR